MISQAAFIASMHSSSFDQFRRCCAEVPSELLDEQGELLESLIAVAFDTLQARILDLRVVASAPARLAEA
jgi:hypothetical protein